MKTKPYVILSPEILKIIEKYYKVRNIDHILERFCFSNPLLENHQCNNLALDNGEGCEYCKNIPENFNCHVTCDVSHVCHAAYAYRVGIGGEDVVKAVRANSEKGYEELLVEINSVGNIKKEKEVVVEEEIDQTVYSKEEELVEEDQESCCSEEVEETGEEKMSEFKVIDETTEPKEAGRPEIPEGEELFTCKQVAEALGCTLMNIYQKIAANKVISVGSARKRRIPRSEVERLLADKERKAKRRVQREEAQRIFDEERAAMKAAESK